MLKLILLIYLLFYLLVVAGAAIYSRWVKRSMTNWGLLVAAIGLVIVTGAAVSYGRGYQDLQMVGFAVGFCLISLAFLFTQAEKQEQFFLKMSLHFIRFLLHIQFILFLYLFR